MIISDRHQKHMLYKPAILLPMLILQSPDPTVYYPVTTFILSQRHKISSCLFTRLFYWGSIFY
jgi:hypothetical protein